MYTVQSQQKCILKKKFIPKSKIRAYAVQPSGVVFSSKFHTTGTPN